MRITKLIHSGMIVTSESTSLICDPLLSGYFVESVFSMPRDYKIDKKAISQIRFDGILISHDHRDHFHLESLNHFHRDCPIYFPRGAEHIAEQLRVLGFKRFVPMVANEPQVIGNMELIPTPSNVSFPEVGFLFRSKGVNVLNLVDSSPEPSWLERLSRKYGSPDLLFASYQVLNEDRVPHRDLSTVFPTQAYEELLQVVQASAPKFVSPLSCDLICNTEKWLNYHRSPVTQKNFARDIRSSDSKITVFPVHAGQHIEVFNGSIRPAAPVFPQLKLKEIKLQEFSWQPEVGHRPVKSRISIARSERALKQAAQKFFEEKLYPAIERKCDDQLSSLLRQKRMKWKIRLVCRKGFEISRVLDFSFRPARWIDEVKGDDLPGIETIHGLGELIAFERGEYSSYPIVAGHVGVFIQRYYEVRNWKVEAFRMKNPVAYFLGEQAYLNSVGLTLKKCVQSSTSKQRSR